MKRRKSITPILDFVRAVLQAVFLALTIISASNKWPSGLTATFLILFGFFLLLSVVKPLYSKERLNMLDWIEVAYHFFLMIVFAVVDAISLKDFFTENTTQIICVVGSGLFTLYGVALTIKFNIWNEQDRERNKARPHVFPVTSETWASIKDEQKRTKTITDIFSNLEQSNKKEARFCFGELRLYNSDASTCDIKGMLINKDDFIIFKFDEALIKDSYNGFSVDYQFGIDSVENISLIFGDMLGNTYLCDASFGLKTNKKNKCTQINILGFYETELRNDINCNKIVKAYVAKNRK